MLRQDVVDEALTIMETEENTCDAASDPNSDSDPGHVGSEHDAGSPIAVRPPPAVFLSSILYTIV